MDRIKDVSYQHAPHLRDMLPFLLCEACLLPLSPMAAGLPLQSNSSNADHKGQKMNNLRIEADEAHEKNEELKAKVKTLEQENMTKEQELTSLTHRNQVLEASVEKLESAIKEAKATADEGAQHGTQNETLQRRLQLLEEEAEEADKKLRETHDKFVTQSRAEHGIQS